MSEIRINLGRLGVSLREPSTWRGLVMILTAVGVQISPEQVNATIAAGVALAGMIGVFFKDQSNDKPSAPTGLKTPTGLLLLLVPALFLGGCASLQDAGVAQYSLAPYTDASGQQKCCSLNVTNGKNVGQVKAHIKGPDYEITLEEVGVDAAHSQAIAAGAATGAVEAVAPLLKVLAPLKAP